jgi:ribonuclease HI
MRCVLALADDDGRLHVERRRVEIRFSPLDPRAYRAKPCNVRLLPGEPSVRYEALPPGVRPERKRRRREGPSPRRDAPRAKPAAAAPTALDGGAWIVHSDASYLRGHAGAGLVVVTPSGEVLEHALPLARVPSSVIAEASALLEAVARVPDGARVVFHTDCVSLVDTIEKRPRRREAPLFADLRVGLARFSEARVVHVKGHAGHPLNERADRLASQARKLAMVRAREARAEGLAMAVLCVLEARGFRVTKAIEERVQRCEDEAELTRWLRRAAVVDRAAHLFEGALPAR